MICRGAGNARPPGPDPDAFRNGQSHRDSEVSMPDQPSRTLPECLAEFLGTFILIIFGVGVVAQVVASGNGDANAIHFAWGFGVTFGVYVAARISGAHLNPAVTLSLALFRGFAWSKVAPYVVAQFLGAFAAALVIRWNYRDAIHTFDPGLTIKSQGIFSTLPDTAHGVGQGGALLDQIIGTAILLLVIAALTDLLNTAPGANLGGLLIGFLVVAIGMALGSNAGYAINPARDFGPRVAEFITGYGGAMRDGTGKLYFWVPIVGPLIGGPLGMLVYDLLIGRNIKRLFGAAGQPDQVGEIPTDAGSSERAATRGHRGATPGDPAPGATRA